MYLQKVNLSLYKPFLHLIYILISTGVGVLGVFLIGVRLIGDNPGAIFGGIISFIAAYVSLVAAESILENRILRKNSLPRTAAAAVVAVMSSLLAAETVQHGFVYFEHHFRNIFVVASLCIFSFLLLEAVLYLALIRGFDLISRLRRTS